MIQSARLTELLIIQRLDVSGTSYGGVIENWCDYKTVYASIITQRGNTSFNDGNHYQDTISFYLRWIPLQKKGYRIKYKGNCNDFTYYEINNLTTIQRNQALVIDCSSVE